MPNRPFPRAIRDRGRRAAPPAPPLASDAAEVDGRGPQAPHPPATTAAERDHVRHVRERHNERALRFDSMAVGVVNAATPFLPVFVARLGGSSVEVGLIGVASALGALVIAVPIGAFLENRADLVRWFSVSRLIAWLGYAGIAVLVLVVPSTAAITAVLLAWIVIAAPSTIGQVAFNIVMNDVAGPGGRYELLGRRWATMGLTTAVAVAVIGVLLELVPFPANYQLVFVGFSVAGVIAFRYERRLLLVRQPAGTATRRLTLGALAPPSWRELASRHRTFVRYLVAHVVLWFGGKLVAPLITLYYVRSVHASDAAIGLIATASSLATFVGFHAWRRVASRRGGRSVLLASAFTTAVWPAVLGLAPDPLWAGIVTAIGSAGTAGLTLALFDELMRRVAPARAMALSAIDYAASNAVGIVAPLVGAVLADRVGLPAALVVGSAIALAGVGLFAREGRIARVSS